MPSKVKTLSILTLGCSKNAVDSEHVLAALSSEYQLVSGGKCDVFLINTCSFIADAKQESIDAILEAVQLKAAGVYGSVVVFGCLGQRYADQMPQLIPEVDAWFGARDFEPLLRYLGVETPIDQTRRMLSTPSHYAYLKISEGCDRHCSYCAIPLIRGAHKSVPIETLVSEAECLAAKGVKELIVIAQDSTYYGLDLYGRRCLAQLLDELSKVEGIQWIRIHYSYPASFPEDVLQLMASNRKICKYMDIPLQHASTKMLRSMRRGVDEGTTRALVEKMRSAVSDVVLRTTMIVGYPGETEEDFEALLQFVRDARFERLGAFRYSEEEDTFAAKTLADDVPQQVKDERYERLMEVQQEISLAYNRSRIGMVIPVIVDAYEDGVLVCRSEGDSPEVDAEVLTGIDAGKFPGIDPESLVGSFVQVKINGADSYDLSAELFSVDARLASLSGDR